VLIYSFLYSFDDVIGFAKQALDDAIAELDMLSEESYIADKPSDAKDEAEAPAGE